MPPVARGDQLEVVVESLATGGRGLARLDGYVVFVDGALPGDRARVRVDRAKGRYAEARTLELLGSGPDRVPAPCSHVAVCGGCRFQEFAYPAQLRHKRAIVEESLKHLGGMELPVREVIPAPSLYRYRNKMEFSFGEDSGGVAALGLHHRGRYERIFDVDTCHIAPEAMNVAVRKLREMARRDGVDPYHAVRHTGVLRFLALRHSAATGELLVNLVVSEDRRELFDSWAREFAASVPGLAGFILSLHREAAQAVKAETWDVLWGRDRIVERLNDLEYEISPWSFFQTNSAQAERLYREALAAGEVRPDDRVLDLYCGTGTLALTFARHAQSAWGVESVEEAIVDARRNAERNEIANTRFFAAEARRWLREGGPRELAPTLVIVDPPRAGLHPRVIDRVCELAPRRIVYVSCNPTTFARDLQHFARLGYAAPWVQPVDMFPHTDHVECVAPLVPASPQGAIPAGDPPAN